MEFLVDTQIKCRKYLNATKKTTENSYNHLFTTKNNSEFDSPIPLNENNLKKENLMSKRIFISNNLINYKNTKNRRKGIQKPELNFYEDIDNHSINSYFCIKESGRFSSKFKISFPFQTDFSRKREKRNLRKRPNRILTRVHNMDSMLKKIKSKYLKFLLNCLREKTGVVNLGKFDQENEVRNLDIYHNRDEFINLTILEFILNSNILDENGRVLIRNYLTQEKVFFSMKIKDHYFNYFLKSGFFYDWMKDPIGIKKIDNSYKKFNKNCLKYPRHSKNIFMRNKENYTIYKKLLVQTTGNFIFYFQNNPLKYGKKYKNQDKEVMY